MISLYCTPARVNMETGGGATTVTELAALREVSEVGLIIAGDDLAPWHQKVGDSPFLEDYYALEQIKDRHFDIAHFYGGCFTQTARVLKERGTKISWAAAAHDRKVSIEEFQRLGMEYPFNHMSDDRLFEMYTEGYRLADIVLSSSHKSAGILRDMGCKRVKVVPGGIELPKKVKPIPSNFDVGYLGALGPDKGVIYLIQGWGMLNYPDSKLMLAGWGTDTLETFIRQVSNQGNFALLGRVPDVADFYNAISIYIQPCFSEDTRVLTKDGPKDIEDIKVGEKVWTLSNVGTLELNAVERIFRNYYRGSMVSFQNKQVSLLVTPNHRIYYRDRDGVSLDVKEARDFALHPRRFRIPTTGSWKGRDNEFINVDELIVQKQLSHMGREGYYEKWQKAMELRENGWGGRKISKTIDVPESTVNSWLYNSAKPWGNLRLLPEKVKTATLFELIGWYISEGSISQGYISISCLSQEARERVLSLINELGLRAAPSDLKRGNINFYCITLRNILEECGTGAKQKIIPRWCLEFSPKWLTFLYDGLMAGDGSRKGHHVLFYTSSDHLAIRFVELCLKLGYSPKKVRRHTKAHTINLTGQLIGESDGWYISVREKHNKGTVKAEHILSTSYNGIVWCISTRNRNLFVERDDLISVSGNSVTEGCGLEIPEAMSYGRVVIAAEGAGAAEIIEDGVDGFVVPIRDPKAIADKIDWCKRNRQLLPEMGERAKKKASNYTWDKIRKQYVQILVELMKG